MSPPARPAGNRSPHRSPPSAGRNDHRDKDLRGQQTASRRSDDTRPRDRDSDAPRRKNSEQPAKKRPRSSDRSRENVAREGDRWRREPSSPKRGRSPPRGMSDANSVKVESRRDVSRSPSRRGQTAETSRSSLLPPEAFNARRSSERESGGAGRRKSYERRSLSVEKRERRRSGSADRRRKSPPPPKRQAVSRSPDPPSDKPNLSDNEQQQPETSVTAAATKRSGPPSIDEPEDAVVVGATEDFSDFGDSDEELLNKDDPAPEVRDSYKILRVIHHHPFRIVDFTTAFNKGQYKVPKLIAKRLDKDKQS